MKDEKMWPAIIPFGYHDYVRRDESQDERRKLYQNKKNGLIFAPATIIMIQPLLLMIFQILQKAFLLMN